MARVIYLFVVFFSTGQIIAQQYVDLIQIEYDYGLSQEFKDSATQAHFSELAIDALAPIVLNEKVAILTGALLEQTQFSLNPNEHDRKVFGLMLKAGINIKHNDKWSGNYLFLPKLSSDLKKIGNRDVQFGALVFMKYAPKPNFNYRFGIYVNRDLFGPIVVPIFGVYLLKNRWEINSSLPINADVSYRIFTNIKFGVRFQGLNKSYMLHEGIDKYVEKVNNEITLYSRWSKGKTHFQLSGGYGVGRSFRSYDLNDQLGIALSAIKINNHRTPLNPTFSDGFILKAGITFRMPTNPSTND